MEQLSLRVKKAVPILQRYFQDIKKDAQKELLKILDDMGIDDSDIGIQTLESATTTFEDFESNFSTEFPNFPPPRLKLAWEILKGKSQHTDSTDLSELRPIGQWNDRELLAKYSKDCPRGIQDELTKRSKGYPVIILKDSGDIDFEASLTMLRKARHQKTPETFIIDKEIKLVYRIGEFPLSVFYECPIHQNILLVDSYCEKCGTKWNLEEKDRNAFLRLIVNDKKNVETLIYRDMDFKKLSETFPDIFLKFKDLKEEDKLPSLKRKLSRTNSSDPFRITGHKSY
jgi:hypothetical protein